MLHKSQATKTQIQATNTATSRLRYPGLEAILFFRDPTRHHATGDGYVVLEALAQAISDATLPPVKFTAEELRAMFDTALN